MRAPGGGRKLASEADPGLLPALTALVASETRGDPESPLVWTTKSTKNLADALARDGHVVSDRTVARMLRAQGFSLQANSKVTEGRQHIDRDAQFSYLNAQASSTWPTRSDCCYLRKQNFAGALAEMVTDRASAYQGYWMSCYLPANSWSST